MNILQGKCFTKEWLDQQREALGRVDPGLLEKSIHALELVGLLAAKDLPFSFKGIWPVEESYREESFSREQILDDTLEAARLISMLDLRGCPAIDEAEILRTGIKQLDSHIIGLHFNLNEAKTCAAKVAWLTRALNAGTISDSLPRYTIEELREVAAVPLSGEYASLNRLKGGAPEAYYYWLKACGLNANL